MVRIGNDSAGNGWRNNAIVAAIVGAILTPLVAFYVPRWMDDEPPAVEGARRDDPEKHIGEPVPAPVGPGVDNLDLEGRRNNGKWVTHEDGSKVWVNYP